MDNTNITEMYKNLLDYLNDEQSFNFIWYEGIKINAFLDNYFKFYFFKKGIDEGYYPMCNFTKEHTSNPSILKMWEIFEEDLNRVLFHNSNRPMEFLLDFVWFDKTVQNIPFCMEMEKENNIDKIIFDFKKLIFFKSNFKSMIFSGQRNMDALKNNLVNGTFSMEEKYLLISLEKVKEKVENESYKINHSIKGKLLSKDSERIIEDDLEDGTLSLIVKSDDEVVKLIRSEK